MSQCLACKSCVGQCPIKVDVPEFRSKFLALYHTRYARPLKDYFVANLERFVPIAAKFAGLANFMQNLPPVKSALPLGGLVDSPSYRGLTSISSWRHWAFTMRPMLPQALKRCAARARSHYCARCLYLLDTQVTLDILALIKQRVLPLNTPCR